MNASVKDRKPIEYETPQVITYAVGVILELGPAQAFVYGGSNWPPYWWP